MHSPTLGDCRRSQVEEVDALLATYPEVGAVMFSTAETGLLNTVRSSVDSADIDEAVHTLPELSGTVRLLDSILASEPVALRFRLPAHYPVEPPCLQVMCATGRDAHGRLTEAVNRCIKESAGQEVLLLALTALEACAAEIAAEEPTASQTPTPTAYLTVPSVILRRAAWFHHIKSLEKRKSIVSWARELGVRGFSKPGFPGVIVFEGERADAEEYWGRLRALRWQAASVRAEEEEECNPMELEASYRFTSSLQELAETDMDVLGALCRDAGLEHLFKAALKL